MITALIVDDEAHNRQTLRNLLTLHCPKIQVLAEAVNAEDAFLKINTHEPQLVFLDVKMPDKSGFALLKLFPEINFEVVFVSAYDRYAIRAFEFNAVGYILKPIDQQKLIKSVDKAISRIEAEPHNNAILHFVKTLSDKEELVHKLSVHHNGKVFFINVSDIACIESKDDHTIITLQDLSHYYSSKDLLQFERMFEITASFTRTSKHVIVNVNFIKSYFKGEPCIVELKTGQTFEVSRRRKSEILNRLETI